MDHSSNNGSRNIVLVLVAIVALLLIAWAAGLFNVDTSGSLKAPEVSVQGGEVPDVQVETAKVDVGSKDETIKVPEVKVDSKETSIKVPTLDIQKPGDDGNANK